MQARGFFSGCLAGLAAAVAVVAQSPIKPGSMPSADRVRAEIKGANPMETAARQMGAFVQLRRIVETLAGQRNFTDRLTAEEKRLIGEYNWGYHGASLPYAKLGGEERSKWYQLHSFYETDPKFREELLERFLPPALREEYYRAKGVDDAKSLARAQAAERERQRIQAEREAQDAQAKLAETAAAGKATGNAVLSVESGLGAAAGSGDPLGGRPVFLFKESFRDFLRREVFGGMQLPANVSPLAAWAEACRTGNQLCRDALRETQPIFAGQARTDSTGKVKLPGVPPGRYFLLSSAIVDRQVLVWDLEVSLKAGETMVRLDTRNITPLNDAQTRALTSGSASAATSAAPSPAPKDLPPAPPRPSGPRTSVVTIEAKADHVTPIARTTFYLLVDDFERILQRAGFEQQLLLGERLSLLASVELLKRWMAIKDGAGFKLLEALSGESALPADIPRQHAIATKALSDHTVAVIKTDIYGKGSSASIPAGTYYLYGTAEEFVKTGARGTLSGDRVTLTDTGYQKATIWNLRVIVKPGQNSVQVTPDNAAEAGQ